MADFPIEAYLQAFQRRDANQQAANPNYGALIAQGITKGAELAVNRNLAAKDEAKKMFFEMFKDQIKDKKLVDAQGNDVDADTTMQVLSAYSQGKAALKADKDGSIVVGNSKGQSLGYKWVSKDEGLKFTEIVPTADNVDALNKAFPGYNFVAGQAMKIPTASYNSIAKGLGKPAKAAKTLINIDADGKLYDANMQPIGDTSSIDWSNVVKNQLPKPADATAEALNKGKLAQGGIDSVNDIKGVITPDVFSDIKIAMKDPTGAYKETLSADSKRAYAALRNAVGNILYIKTGAAATPREIDEQLAKYSPSVAQSMGDWQKNTLGLLERDLNYYVSKKTPGKATETVDLKTKYGLE